MISRPKIRDIYERVNTDINSSLGVKKRSIPKGNMISILSMAIAGVCHSLYGYIDYKHKFSLPNRARGSVLDAWAFVFGLVRKRSTRSSGVVKFKLISQINELRENIFLQHEENQYRSTNYKLSDGYALIDISSIEAGANQNILATAKISLVSPVVGLESIGEVTDTGITGGADEETDDSLRSRLLERIRKPPQGGAAHDYETWAKQISGVTRAFVYPKRRGVGTVDVGFVTDFEEKIVPDKSSDIFKQVERNIKEKAPATAVVNVIELKEKHLNLKIRLHPNLKPVQESVKAEIKDLLRREASAGYLNSDVGTIRLSRLREAISQSSGEEYHDLIYPTDDVRVDDAEILVFGGIEWLV